MASHTAPTTQTNNNINVINRLIVVDTPQSHTHTRTTTTTTTAATIATTTTTMRLVTINTPFCLRKDAGDASEGGGFFFVNNGILVFRDDTMMFYIYEGETFQNDGYNSVPALQINLRTVASIDFKKIHSTGLNFEGGLVAVTGLFDRKSEEIVTIKMNRTDYKLLATLLKEMDL